MRPLTYTLFAALFMPPLNACAQGGGASSNEAPIMSPAHPLWLLEQPYADGPMLTARTVGDSAYGDYHAKANLAISCHPKNPDAGLTLDISPQSLGVDIAPFEGKDASANGPLRITTGTRTAVEQRVNGFWYAGGALQIGTVFALSTIVPRKELAYWASDASRGQPLTLWLAPATEGRKPLTASFTLPANNAGLKKVIQPCLDNAGATTR